MAGPASEPAPPHRMKTRRFSRLDSLTAWLFLTPSLTLFTVFIIIPTIAGIGLSFFSWNFFGTPEFVGLAKFERLFIDPEAWQSLGVTMEYVVLGIIPTMLIGFMLAVLVNTNMPGVGIARVLYFVPVVMSVVVSAVLWGFLYDPRQGPIAAVFRFFGLQAPTFLQDPLLTLPSLVVMMIWAGLPIVIILYLAGLQRVPEDIYAAAELDGAGPWRRLWAISWPNVMSTTMVIGILEVIAFVAGSLDVALVMTNGGPLNTTRPLSLYAYQQAFIHQDVGYASVLCLLQIVIIVAILAVGRALTARASK
jgi:ABC-type sugar transport system permease subunit